MSVQSSLPFDQARGNETPHIGAKRDNMRTEGRRIRRVNLKLKLNPSGYVQYKHNLYQQILLNVKLGEGQDQLHG